MNPIHNPIHADWADSMADWGMSHQEVVQHRALEAERMNALTADYTPADRHESASAAILNTVQGRPEQAWPARRCSPEMAVYDPTEDDDARREELTPAEASLLCAIYLISTLLVLWIFLTIAKAWS